MLPTMLQTFKMVSHLFRHCRIETKFNNDAHMHTHTHTYMYIYYFCMGETCEQIASWAGYQLRTLGLRISEAPFVFHWCDQRANYSSMTHPWKLDWHSLMASLTGHSSGLNQGRDDSLLGYCLALACMCQVTKLRLSCYLVLLSIDSKPR